MNLASWIILGIVVAVLALAVKATFFKKKRRGGCCDTGDEGDAASKDGKGGALDLGGFGCSLGCDSCPSSSHCASRR